MMNRLATGWLAAAMLAAAPQGASAAMFTLESYNTTAQFATEAADAPAVKGLYDWKIDGVDQIRQQWFCYRVGNAGGEAPIDTLVPLQAYTLDVDGAPGDDFLLARYRDAGNTFELAIRYTISGSSPGNGAATLEEVVRVANLTGQPLDFHLFQYVDFDLSGTAGDDSVVITGTPPNTARQSDPTSQVAETVVTPPPTRFEVNEFQDPNGLEARLADNLPTTLGNVLGPVNHLDATWAFQWDAPIAPHGVFLISKNKSIRAATAVPEPNAWNLGLTALALAQAGRISRIRRRASLALSV